MRCGGHVDVLVLGGTQWVGRVVAQTWLAEGHAVTCLARGESGPVAEGARLVRADRSAPDAYDQVRDHDWDEVVDVSWQPGFVKGAVAALADHARHWTYVSSGNVYAHTDVRGEDESAPLWPPTERDVVDQELYGPAKVACEQAVLAALGGRALVARFGLVTGPGDHTDRTGYWVARAARAPHTPVLVPDAADAPTAVVDVRDAASWLQRCAAAGTGGIFNVVGPVMTFGEWVTLCREVGGHDAEVVTAGEGWLLAHQVAPWAGEESLPLWVGEPGWEGFSDRDGSRAAAAGLTHRDRRVVVADVLAWERERGLDRQRRAGLSPAREAELIEELLRSAAVS